MMKKFFLALCLVLFILLGAGIFKDQIIKAVLTVEVTKIVGAPVHIRGFSLSLLRKSIRIKGFKIYQPAGYPKEALLDLETINIDYDLGALLQKKLHLPLVEISLRELVIIKNENGKLSVDALKVSQKESEAPSTKQVQSEKAVMPVQIDILKLNLGRVINKEYDSKGNPVIKTFDIDIKNRTYQNITSAKQLIGLLLIESMKASAIRGAKIYGAVSLASVAFAPAGLAMVFTAKDSIGDSFDVAFDEAYKVCLEVVGSIGKIKNTNRGTGVIKARVEGASVTIKLDEVAPGRTNLTVSARRFMLPKLQVSGMVLHKITKQLR